MSTDRLKQAIGQALQETRERTEGPRGRALSQDAVAKIIDVSVSAIGEWERGTGGIPPDHIRSTYAALVGETDADVLIRTGEILREGIRRKLDPPSG